MQPERRRKELGQLVRTAREALHLSQQDVAALGGWHKSTVSRLESGNLASQRIETFARLYMLVGPGLDRLGVPRARFLALTTELGFRIGDSSPTTLATHTDGLPTVGGVNAEWQHLFARGYDAIQQGAFEKATWYLQAAQTQTHSADERAAALAQEACARWHLAEDDYRPTRALCVSAITALGLTPTPPHGNTLPALATHLSGTGLSAYGFAAQYLGMVAMRRRDFALAGRWLDAVGSVGRELGDTGLQWVAAHFQMRCHFEAGTRLPLAATWDWREVANRDALEHGLCALAESRRQRLPNPHNHVGLGHDARWEAHLCRCLGRAAEAHKARGTAERLLVGHWGLALVRWDQGQIALEDDQPALANRWLTEALERSWEAKYARGVADALRSLAHLHAQASTNAERKTALACGVGALLAYPGAHDDPENWRTITLCADLVGQMAYDTTRLWRTYHRDLGDAILAGRPPFHYLKGLHTSDPIRAGEVQRVLEAIGQRIGGWPHNSGKWEA